MLQAAGGAGLEEESKLSRLFYLQLYSSVLNAEKETARREARVAREQRLQRLKQSWRSALTSLPRYKALLWCRPFPCSLSRFSWMDVTNLLSRSISSTEQEKDIGDVEVRVVGLMVQIIQ